MCEERFHALRVVEPAAHAATLWGPQHHRSVELPRGSIPDTRRLSDDLVDRRPDEVGELDFCDGAHTVHCGAEGDACDGRLGQGRVNHTLCPELFEEAVCSEEHSAARADILAHDENSIVAAHLFPHRVPYRLYDRLYRYGVLPPLRSAGERCKASHSHRQNGFTSGLGLHKRGRRNPRSWDMRHLRRSS